jgi:hypothetical protein
MTDQPNKNPNKSPGIGGKQALLISTIVIFIWFIIAIVQAVYSIGSNLTGEAEIEAYAMLFLTLVYLGFLIVYFMGILFIMMAPTYIVYKMYTQIKYRITKQPSNTFFLDIVISIIIGIPTSFWLLEELFGI